MSVPYNTILRRVLKAVNGIAGTTASAMATNYAVNPLTTTQADDPVYSLAFIQDAMADIQGRLANEIASVMNPVTGLGTHPWRSYFASTTSNVANDDILPAADQTNVPIIGAWGGVRILAGSTRYPGTPTSIERIRASQQNPDSIYTTTLYEYCIYGQRIYYTDSSYTAILDCCVYNRATAISNIVAASQNMLLPDALADAFVAGVVQAIVVEEEYLAQSGFYRDYFNAAVAAIRAGATAMPGLAVPMGRAA
jgi:hypothetical protein